MKKYPAPEVPRAPAGAGDNRLTDLVHEINEAYEGIRRSAREAAENHLRIGRNLIEIKKILGHGKFGPYIDEFCDVKHRQANYYMKAVELGLTAARIAREGLRSAIDRVDLLIIDSEGLRQEAAPKNIAKPERKRPRRGTLSRSFSGLPRPKDGQVLRVAWRSPFAENKMILMYVWRHPWKIVGAYEGSSKAFNWLRLEYEGDAVTWPGSLDERSYIDRGDFQTNQKLETWEDVCSHIEAYDANYERWLPDIAETYRSSRNNEVWDAGHGECEADPTMFQMLAEWRLSLLILGDKERMMRNILRDEARLKASAEKLVSGRGKPPG